MPLAFIHWINSRGSPPGYWGGVAPPYVDIGGPAPQPHPEHPIVIPPNTIGPGVPTHPIYIPVVPTHPIVIPPGAPGYPAHPIVLPPGAPVAPSHPIVLPPPPEGTKPPPPEGGWGYSPEFGWGYFPAPGEPGPKTK